MITKLTIKEKISLLNGKTAWLTKNIDRIQLPSLEMSDGPHGIRKEKENSREALPATLFPPTTTLASTFNKELAYQMGSALAQEAKEKGVKLILAPGVNIKRNPGCGRNFEYYSEDPILSGEMASSYISGIQSENVGACVKHFAANSQEKYRLTIDSVVDERALREIYLPSFKKAVESNVATIMACYNKVNGIHGCENKELLTDILRNEWGFKGLVVSDWGAVSNPVESIKNGLDLEMPNSNGYNSKKIYEAYKKGQITEAEIDRACNKVIELVKKYQQVLPEKANIEANEEIAKAIAREGIVLLKNEGMLPINKTEKIAVVGEFARKPRTQGGGSSNINPYKMETVLGEIEKYTTNYAFFPGYSLQGDCFNQELIDEVISEVEKFDKVIVFVGVINEAEGIDREDLKLPQGQLELIKALHRVNPQIIICISSGSVVEIDFEKQAKAILNCNLLGQVNGTPLLDILFGKVSPSGRLNETYAFQLEDYSSSKNFADSNNAVYYEESIFVGYRYFNTFGKKVRYPFGYGLSYCPFTYSDLTVDSSTIKKDKKIVVTCKVKNDGSMEAKEVVQLYIENNDSSVYKAKRELKKFTKIELAPQEEKKVEFILDYQDFAYYDVNMKQFHVDKGTYQIQICKNVEEVILSHNVNKKENEEGFIEHKKTAYHNSEWKITTDDFAELMGRTLPPKSIARTAPFTMDSIPEDFQSTFWGRILYKQLIKRALALLPKDASESDKKFIVVNATQMPIRGIVAIGGAGVSPKNAEGIIDFANGKVIRGIIKILKKEKKYEKNMV